MEDIKELTDILISDIKADLEQLKNQSASIYSATQSGENIPAHQILYIKDIRKEINDRMTALDMILLYKIF